jgi:hypothetical protein
MREKATAPSKRAHDVAPNMNSLVSVFHAGSLNTQRAHPQPQRPENNPYCYIPGQYWQTLDYYAMEMDICTDFSDVRVMTLPGLWPGGTLT